MKPKTICAVVLGLALGIGGCGEQSNKPNTMCPFPQSVGTVRVQESEKYRAGLLTSAIANYEAKHKGIEVKEKFEYEKFVGFEVYIQEESACYPRIDTDIADLFQDAINKLKR
mgnify:FL=1